jgi:RES domain
VLPESDLRRVVPALPLISEGGPWTRVLGYHLLQGPPPGSSGPPQPLWPGGPILTGARFNLKGTFGGVYLASDPLTALKEVDAILGRQTLPSSTILTPPWTVFAVEGTLERLLDLTDLKVQARLGTSFPELIGEWRIQQSRHLRGGGPLPPTQLLGRVAYDTGRILGMKFDSAKNPGEGFNVVVFPDRLSISRASFLGVYDPHDLIRQRLP